MSETAADLHGEFEWSEAARIKMNQWYNAGMSPKPDHSRLRHYNSRREIHTMKLAMVSAISAGRGLYVAAEDFDRAQHWLLTAETSMPDVFRAMAQKSDQQLIYDLWYHCYSIYNKALLSERKPLDEKVLWGYLHDRTPHEKIRGIVDTALRVGYFTTGAFKDQYIPRGLGDHLPTAPV